MICTGSLGYILLWRVKLAGGRDGSYGSFGWNWRCDVCEGNLGSFAFQQQLLLSSCGEGGTVFSLGKVYITNARCVCGAAFQKIVLRGCVSFTALSSHSGFCFLSGESRVLLQRMSSIVACVECST